MATSFHLGTGFEKIYKKLHPIEPEGIIYKKINSHNTNGTFFIPGEAPVNVDSLVVTL